MVRFIQWVLLCAAASSGCYGASGYKTAKPYGQDGDVHPKASGDSARSGDARLPADTKPCEAQSDASICRQYAAECGTVEEADVCGVLREVSCGECVLPLFCGGGPIERTCGIESWYELDGSAFGKWSTKPTWSSNEGAGVSMSTAEATDPALALDHLGRLHVVWHDSAGEGTVQTALFDGLKWSPPTVLGRGTPPAAPRFSSMEFGQLYAVWADSHVKDTTVFGDQEGGIRVARIAESGVLEPAVRALLPVRGSSHNSVHPDITVTPQGSPLVVWEDHFGAISQIRLRAFTGRVWFEEPSGAADFDGGVSRSVLGAYEPSVDSDRTGRVGVAWVEDRGSDRVVYARFFDGYDWLEIAGSISGAGVSEAGRFARAPMLRFTGDNRAAIVWNDGTSEALGSPRMVREGDGVWESIAGVGSRTGLDALDGLAVGAAPSIILDGAANLGVAWHEVQGGAYLGVRVATVDYGGAWQDLGLISSTAGPVVPTARSFPAFDASGRLLVAWSRAGANASDIYVQRQDGDQWQGIGTRSARYGGISDAQVKASSPRIDIAADGTITAAWLELTRNAAGTTEVNMAARQYVQGTWRGTWRAYGDEGPFGAPPALPEEAMPRLQMVRAGVAWLLVWGVESPSLAPLRAMALSANSLGDGVLTWASVSPEGESAGITAENGADVHLHSNASGLPVMTWTTGTNVLVSQWSGLATKIWVDVGAGSGSGAGVSNTVDLSTHPHGLHLSDGTLVLTWQESVGTRQHIYAAQWDGSAWIDFSGSSRTPPGLSGVTGSDLSPKFAQDSDGTVWLAYLVKGGSAWSRMTLSAYDGAQWLAQSSPTSLGTYARALRWERTDAGDLVLSWEQSAAGINANLKLKQEGEWKGWPRPTGGGSGLSNSPGASTGLDLAFSATRACGAWAEAGPGNAQILVRCRDVEP